MTHAIQIDNGLIRLAKERTGNDTEKGAIEKAVREYLRIEERRREILDLKHSVRMK